MLLEVYGIVVKHVLTMIWTVCISKQVVGRNTEILRQQADGIEVWLFTLGLVARDGGTLFVNDFCYILLREITLFTQGYEAVCEF